MKTGFIRALIGSCSGTEIFEQLRYQHWLRAGWHLVLMGVLSGILVGWSIYNNLYDAVDVSAQTVYENCGNLLVDSEGIRPEVQPDKLRQFRLIGPTAITYLPENAEALPENFQQDCSSGILANGQQFIMWQALGRDLFRCYVFSPGFSAIYSEETTGRSGVWNILKKAPRWSLPADKDELITADKLQAIGKLMLIGGASAVCMRYFFNIIIYIAMFAGVSALMNMGRPRRFSIKEMVVLAVYAGFPPMVIGTLSEILQLPWLDYNIIYVLGMTFYLIFVMNRLERRRQEREWQSKMEQ